MGISGMREYLEQNDLLQPYTLYDTRVVVDGNNICHQLLDGEGLKQYGGNPECIKHTFSRFFECLLASKIKPFVVFDGAHDEDDKKINHIIKKCEATIQEYERKPDPYLACLPAFAYSMFLDVLNTLKIAHVACDGEADNQIAVLAKRWRCPVISNDGDMYIFDLEGGFINFKDIKFDQNTSDGIQTKIYYVNKTGFPKCLLPFAITVLGSSYVDIDYHVVNKFFRKLGADSCFSHIRKDVKKAFEILKKKVSTEENGVALLHQCVDDKLPSVEAAELKKKINTSLTVYKAINNFGCYDLAKYFEGQIIPEHRGQLPDWVMDMIRSGILSGLPIDVTHGRVILKPTLENFDLPPAQKMTRPLRQIVYGLVLKSCPRKEIEEIIRSEKAMTRVPVKPVFNLESFGQLPTLEEIENQGPDDKIRLLSAMFTVNPESLCRVDQGSALFAIAVGFLIKNITFADKLQVLQCYVLCHLILLHKKERPQLQATYERFVLQNYAPNIFVFHRFLQCYAECLDMACMMNALVGLPLAQPDTLTVYDGKLMYNVFARMMSIPLQKPDTSIKYERQLMNNVAREIDRLLSHAFLGDELFQLYQAIRYVAEEAA